MPLGQSSPTSILSIFIFLCGCLEFKYVSTENTENLETWNENLPRVSMDFKFYLAGGGEECYFQYVYPGSNLYVSYEVIRGGDQAALIIKNPEGVILNPSEWQRSGSYHQEELTAGYHAICIVNKFSIIFSEEPSLVSLYMTVIRYDLWQKHHEEIGELHVNIHNFTSSVQTVESNINHMIEYQYHTRGQEAWDLNLLAANNAYVVRWSLIHIVVIVITTTVQVYFVRKLFGTKHGGGAGFTKSRF